MKKMKNIENLSDKEWEELASIFSDEKSEKSETFSDFMANDSYETEKHWKKLKTMSRDKEINVDNAWEKVSARIRRSDEEINPSGIRIMRSSFLKIAAAALVLIGLGTAMLYLNKAGILNKKTVVATDSNQTNLRIALPDGSNISLNRNTRLSYNASYGESGRKVTLDGEAFFEITPDAGKPFIVDAGKASIEVLGTSFNVITQNDESAVEVFVETGKVMMKDNSGIQENLVIDPGYIGTISPEQSEKRINKNPNYLAWNKGKLVYADQKLENVFKDLERIYDIKIIPSDPEILNNQITTTFEGQSLETIIILICTTFNLDHTQDGNVYHLMEK